MVLDPRRTAVLILDRETGHVDERQSRDVTGYAHGAVNGRVDVYLRGSPSPYGYSARRVVVMHDPASVPLTGAAVEVDGQIWGGVSEAWRFTGPGGSWLRIFRKTESGESHHIYPTSRVRIVADAARHPRVADVMAYWRDVVSRLPDDDPLQLGTMDPRGARSSRSVRRQPVTAALACDTKRRLGLQVAICLAAVPNLDDLDHELVVVDAVDHSVVPDSQPVAVAVAGQLSHRQALLVRVVTQWCERFEDPHSGRPVDPAKLSTCVFSECELVLHAASFCSSKMLATISDIV